MIFSFILPTDRLEQFSIFIMMFWSHFWKPFWRWQFLYQVSFNKEELPESRGLWGTLTFQRPCNHAEQSKWNHKIYRNATYHVLFYYIYKRAKFSMCYCTLQFYNEHIRSLSENKKWIILETFPLLIYFAML